MFCTPLISLILLNFHILFVFFTYFESNIVFAKEIIYKIIKIKEQKQMKKIKFLSKFMATCVIFSLIFTQNVFAEGIQTDYQLAKLQPYVDELEKINSELGLDLLMCLSTPDEIATAYNNYCSMSIENFRNYVVELCNDDTLKDYSKLETATDNVFETNIEICGVVLPSAPYSATQKIYIYSLDNYFTIKTTCNVSDTIPYYQSVDSIRQTISSYPTYKPKSNDSVIPYNFSNNRNTLNFTFTLYYYVDSNIFVDDNYKTISVSLTAGGGDVFVGTTV